MDRVIRIVLPGLAVCWLVLGLSAWRGRRHDVARHGPARWHRAVNTLQRWSPEHNDVPAATTWCRPVTMPAPMADLPRQRRALTEQPAAVLLPAVGSDSEHRT